jgi:small subunit ribosomal protein S18
MPRKVFKRKKKVCFYCTNKIDPNYKSEAILRRMVTERGKIVPRRMTGTCAKHQRKLAIAVKRARHIALLPFVSENLF